MIKTMMGTLLFLTALLAWLTGKPRTKPLLDNEQQSALDACVPKGSAEGNRLTLYTEFKPFMDALLDDMEGAHEHVHMQFFKFEADSVGQHIGSALASKARSGVEVRLLYDDLCTRPHHWYYKKLEEQGVEAKGFGPVPLPFFRKRDNYRNHRKVVVVDGRVAYLGGMNIADRYMLGLPWGKWQDTMVRVEGPAVAQLQHVFLSDWCRATGDLLAKEKYFPEVQAAGESHVEVLTSGPVGPGPEIMHRTEELLDKSQRYIYLESPYLIPTKSVMDALCRTARRGVDVRILIPPRGDRGVATPLASRSYISQAIDAGVKVGFYGAGYLHSKTIVSDDEVAMVTSCNIDVRSYTLDLEVAAVVTGGDFAQVTKAAYEADEALSEYIDPEEWTHRPWHKRIGERLARLLKNQL